MSPGRKHDVEEMGYKGREKISYKTTYYNTEKSIKCSYSGT